MFGGVQKFRREVVDKQNPARYNMPCGSVEAFGLAGRGQCGSSSVVEHHLAKVGVAGPSPVFRSMTFTPAYESVRSFFLWAYSSVG